jgi:hypothetical protein
MTAPANAKALGARLPLLLAIETVQIGRRAARDFADKSDLPGYLTAESRSKSVPTVRVSSIKAC